MRRAAVSLVMLALLAACRTTRPAGEETPIVPLASKSATDARRELAARRAQLTGQRSLVNIRATKGGRSQSFRAQLQIEGSGRMLLTAFTPFGTNAVRIYAAGDQVTFINDFEGTLWHGSVAEFSGAFSLFGGTPPSAMGLLIAGLPADGKAIAYDYDAGGLSRASVGDVVITFEPPSYPPKHVNIVRGEQKLEIETLESMMTTTPIVTPDAPKTYRCCVPPRL